MKAYLTQLTGAASSPLQARNIAREYLQARILGSLQRSGAMIPLAFHGGTALRFLYSIPRYSEDLDFALATPTYAQTYDFRGWLRTIRSELVAEGYPVELKISDQKPVHSAFVRFPGLPHELGLSPHTNEVLAIKLEVDTNPPAGAGLAISIVRRHTILRLQHHDRASLLAGKLHAILQRPYTKGRDIYDLLWYLSAPEWPPPNLALLNNALRQTSQTAHELTPGTWRETLRQHIQQLDWAQVIADVQPFIERPADMALLTPGNLLQLLEQTPP